MLLLVEQGNTNTVFALWDEHGCVCERRVATRAEQCAESYMELLASLQKMAASARLEACLVSTVVPAAQTELGRCCLEAFGLAPLVIGEDLAPDIEIRLPHPTAVGSDRLVNAIGGYAAYGGPLLIVDSGTATKFDLVSAQGAFLGGVIAPGLWSGAEALVERCALLAPTSVDGAPRLVGRDTPAALRSGLYWGHLSMIEGLIQRIQDEFAERLTVVATGGVIGMFPETIVGVDHYAPRLTQTGMIELWRRTRC
jgi:type III pantothenate kinase